MAEVLFIQYIEEKGFDAEVWSVASAGCWAYPGFPATLNAIKTVHGLGCDLNSHTSQAVTQELLKDFSLILCMENEHKQFISEHLPRSSEKVFLLTEMIGEEVEIDDPVVGPIEDYQDTAAFLKNIFQSGFERIKELSSSN
jgi:protein-tyrosine-phosphatase